VSDGINSSGNNIIFYTHGKQKTHIFTDARPCSKNKNMVVDILKVPKYIIFIRNETCAGISIIGVLLYIVFDFRRVFFFLSRMCDTKNDITTIDIYSTNNILKPCISMLDLVHITSFILTCPYKTL